MTNKQIKTAKDRIDKAKAALAGNYGFLPPNIWRYIERSQSLLHKTWLVLDVEEKANNLRDLEAKP